MTASRRIAVLAAAIMAGAGARAAPAGDRAAAPLAFHKATKRAEVELRLPKALAAWPAFRDALLVSDTAKLNGFVRAAENAPAPGKGSRRNWRRIGYQLAGSTGRLVSVIRSDDRDTGGARSQPRVSGVLWDQRTKRRLPLAALFRPDADPAPLDRAVCEAVQAAKAERGAKPPRGGETWTCPLFSQTQGVLAPSATGGKAGGLIMLINAYDVEPGAEGQYRVMLPLPAFRRALRTTYASEFAGAPSEAGRKLTRVTPVGSPPPRRLSGM